jgi:DNA-binding PadR family transcriptional regulator
MSEPLTPAAFALLLALTEGERHGYRLITEVGRLTGGEIVLGPGTLYRTLQRMRVDGLVAETTPDETAVRADRRAERRRGYRITPTGRRAVRAEVRRLATLLASDTAQALLHEDEET